jgi:chromosome segregation ATPase
MIKEIWNEWRKAPHTDKKIAQKFEEACTVSGVYNLLIELESANQRIAELDKERNGFEHDSGMFEIELDNNAILLAESKNELEESADKIAELESVIESMNLTLISYHQEQDND